MINLPSSVMLKHAFGVGLVVIATGMFASACGTDGPFGEGPAGAGGDGAAAAGGGSVGGNGSGAGTSNGGSGGEGEPMCPHEGPDIVDPNAFELCPSCSGGARCIPNSLIPADQQDQLGDCDADNKCVPDDFIKTGGNFIAQTCTSVAGGEGRCLSVCIPQVADQAALLPQDTCPDHQVCAPCYDPITGEDTGGCSLSCDPGPVEPPVTLPGCCDGVGTCVPRGLVPPDQVDALPQDTCPMDANDYVCTPTVFITDPMFTPPSCITDAIIGGGQPGACLPSCLITGFEGFLTTQSSCADNEKCAPCNNPLTGAPTGACEIGG